jgi:hypothetical protein
MCKERKGGNTILRMKLIKNNRAEKQNINRVKNISLY